MKNSIVLISLVAAALFASFYLLVFFNKAIYGGIYPLWWTMIGAIVMCFLPIKIILSDGSTKIAAGLAILALMVSSAQLFFLHSPH